MWFWWSQFQYFDDLKRRSPQIQHTDLQVPPERKRKKKDTAYLFYTWNYLHFRLLFSHGLFTGTVKIMTIYLGVFIVLSFLIWIKCIYRRHRRALLKSLKHLSSRETVGSDIRALVVTAHPDDECMFFAPTIIRLVELNASVHLLCLSEGTVTTQRWLHINHTLMSQCKVRGRIVMSVVWC